MYPMPDVDALQKIKDVLNNDGLSDRDALLKALRKALCWLVDEYMQSMQPPPAPPPIVTEGEKYTRG